MNSKTVHTEIWNTSDNLNFDTKKRYQATVSDKEEILNPYEKDAIFLANLASDFLQYLCCNHILFDTVITGFWKKFFIPL